MRGLKVSEEGRRGAPYKIIYAIECLGGYGKVKLDSRGCYKGMNGCSQSQSRERGQEGQRSGARYAVE